MLQLFLFFVMFKTTLFIRPIIHKNSPRSTICSPGWIFVNPLLMLFCNQEMYSAFELVENIKLSLKCIILKSIHTLCLILWVKRILEKYKNSFRTNFLLCVMSPRIRQLYKTRRRLAIQQLKKLRVLIPQNTLNVRFQ